MPRQVDQRKADMSPEQCMKAGFRLGDHTAFYRLEKANVDVLGDIAGLIVTRDEGVPPPDRANALRNCVVHSGEKVVKRGLVSGLHSFE